MKQSYKQIPRKRWALMSWGTLEGWRSSESTQPPTNVARVQIPALTPYVGWVCCWFSPLLRGVFSGYSGFPLSSKTNISKFQFDHESGRRRTTLWMCYLLLIIYFYLFIHFIFYFYQLLKGQKRPNAMFTMTVNSNWKRTT